MGGRDAATDLAHPCSSLKNARLSHNHNVEKLILPQWELVRPTRATFSSANFVTRSGAACNCAAEAAPFQDKVKIRVFSAACEAVPFQSKFKLTHYTSFF